MMWGEGLEMHTKPWVRARARRAYWENMKPASGRPFCPDNWGVTKGDAILVQQQEATRKEQIAEVQKIQMEKFGHCLNFCKLKLKHTKKYERLSQHCQCILM